MARRRSRTGWSPAAVWRADRDYFQACRLEREGKPGEAVKAFDRVIAAFPRHTRAHCQRALALAQAGRVGEAVRAARRASELAPANSAPLLFLGQIQYDAGHFEEARKAFSAAARLDPGNRLVQAYLGLSFLALGRMREGGETLTKHLLYANAGLEGRVLALAERFLWEHRDEARPLEEQLTPEEGGRDPGSAGLGLRLASALRRILLMPLVWPRGRRARAAFLAEEAMSLGDSEAALTALRAAREAGADPTWVGISLASAYLHAGKPEAALEELSPVLPEAQKDPSLALLAGEALFESGRYGEAREPLGIAAERFTREFAPCYYRGLCEVALGQTQAATEWFIRASERLHPHLAEKRLEEMLRVWGRMAAV